MGDFGERTGRFIDWLIRGEMVVRILAALGIGKLLQWLLERFSQISGTLATAIWLISSAVIFLALIRIGRWQNKKKPQFSQASGVGTPGGPQFEKIDEYYRIHKGPMMDECEVAIRKFVEKYKGQERDDFFVRGLSTVLVVAFFDETWNTIFGSQILALEHLNKQMSKIEDLQPYYQHELDKRPQYPFESWFGYLKSNVLIKQEGYNIGITLRGKEFLKYLVNAGRTARDKSL